MPLNDLLFPEPTSTDLPDLADKTGTEPGLSQFKRLLSQLAGALGSRRSPPRGAETLSPSRPIPVGAFLPSRRGLDRLQPPGTSSVRV